MPGVTLTSQFRDRHWRLSSLRSPWGGGRANRTTGPRAKVAAPGLHVRPKALASPRGRVPAEQEHLAAATPERLVHRALRGPRPRVAEAPRRPRAAAARHPPVEPLPPDRPPAPAPDRTRAPAHERPAALLPRRARRPRRPDLRDAQVPHPAPRRGGAPWPIPRPRAGRAHACRDDAARPPPTRHAARRAPAAVERPLRRHEPRRPAPDPP